LAEEVVQQAAVNVLKTEARYDGRSNASYATYFLGICRNVLKQHYRDALTDPLSLAISEPMNDGERPSTLADEEYELGPYLALLEKQWTRESQRIADLVEKFVRRGTKHGDQTRRADKVELYEWYQQNEYAAHDKGRFEQFLEAHPDWQKRADPYQDYRSASQALSADFKAVRQRLSAVSSDAREWFAELDSERLP
jgi:hypothetical protein